MGNEKAKALNAHSSTSYANFLPEDLVLVRDRKHPLYDPRVEWDVNEALVKNIMIHGIIDAVTVRKNGEKDGKAIVEVVAGRQRVKACIEANKRLVLQGLPPKLVPTSVRKGTDLTLMGIMVSENEIRRADEDIIKAEKAQRMLDGGMPIDQVADQFGVTVTSISNYTALLDCDKIVLDAVTSGEISASLARKLSKLPREEQVTQLGKLRADGTLKGHKADKAVSNATKSKSTARMGKKELLELRMKFLHAMQQAQENSPNQCRFEFGYDVVSFIMENKGESFDDFYKKCMEERAKRGEAEIVFRDQLVGPEFGDENDSEESEEENETPAEETTSEPEVQPDDGLEFDTADLSKKVADSTPPPARTRKRVTRAHRGLTK